MNRLMLGVAVAVVAGLSGCASQAEYVSRQGDSGVVSIPANTDSWPTYNRRAAIGLIEKHVGPDFEIIDEGKVPVGTTTTNHQNTNNEQTFNNSNPFLPATKQTTTTTTTTRDVTHWHIAYRRKAMPFGTTGNGIQQTQYVPGTGGVGVQPAGGIFPSVGPNAGVVPAGGPTITGSAGATFMKMQ
jgi:hypothetical protein